MTDTFSYDSTKFDTLTGSLDPFIGTPQQTHRHKAYCKVYVNGVDVTANIEPFLISVRIVDDPTLSCELELDDRDAKLPIPPLLSPVEVLLGWQSESMIKVFTGVILDIEHGFGRKQGGRRMWIHAKGTDMLSTHTKTPMQDMLGEGAPPGKKEGEMHGMPDWIQQVAKNGGLSANVSGMFSAIKQDYWSQTSSPMHEIIRQGERAGAMVQFAGNNTVNFEAPGERGLSCRAVWRDNLIGWRVRPISARAAWGGARQQWFDGMLGQWKQAASQGASGLGEPFSQAAASFMPSGPAASESGAAGDNTGADTASESSTFGHGRIVINGEPAAKWNSLVELVGARPGVDGLYLIMSAEHQYSRQGYVTWLDVMPYLSTSGQWGVPGDRGVGRGWGTPPRPAPNIG